MKVRQLHIKLPLKTWWTSGGMKHSGAFLFRCSLSSPVLTFTNIVVNMERWKACTTTVFQAHWYVQDSITTDMMCLVLLFRFLRVKCAYYEIQELEFKSSIISNGAFIWKLFWLQGVIVILLRGLHETVGTYICGFYHAILIEDLEKRYVWITFTSW